MSDRVSIDDLLMAAEWCTEGFEVHPDGFGADTKARLDRVAAWLRAEARRREVEQMARQLARLSGGSATSPAVRAKARQLVENESTPRERPPGPLWYGRGS